MISNNITKEHLLSAINEINNYPETRTGRASSTYDLIYKDIAYPPKLVVSIANKFANGEALNAIPSSFTTKIKGFFIFDF